MDQNNGKLKARKPRMGKITAKDAESVAKLVALRFSEKMACNKLALPYHSWAKWKERKKGSVIFDNLLTRMKADKLSNMLESIEDAATGANGIRHDWRAAREMLNIVDKATYSDASDAGQAVQHVTITVDKLQIINQMVQAELAKEKALPGVSEVKQIECLPSSDVTTTHNVSQQE